MLAYTLTRSCWGRKRKTISGRRKKFSFRVSLVKIRSLMLLANVERAEFNVKLACSGVLENYGEREFKKRSFRCIIYRRFSGINFLQKASCKPALAGLSALFNIYKAAPWPTPLARRERNSIILVRLSGLKKKLESADITESPGTICKWRRAANNLNVCLLSMGISTAVGKFTNSLNSLKHSARAIWVAKV